MLIGATVVSGVVWVCLASPSESGVEWPTVALSEVVGAWIGGVISAPAAYVAHRRSKLQGAVERHVLSASSPTTFTLRFLPVDRIAVSLNGRCQWPGSDFIQIGRTVRLVSGRPSEGDVLIFEYDYESGT
jgi:hypothetical protein